MNRILTFLLRGIDSDVKEKVDFSDIVVHLSILGLNPSKTEPTELIKFLLFVFNYSLFIAITLLEIIHRSDFQTLKGRVTILIPQLQIISMMIMLISNKKSISILMQKTRNFWSLNYLNDIDLKYAYSAHRNLRIVYRTYQRLLLINCILYNSVPLLLHGRSAIKLYGEKSDGSAPHFNLQYCCILIYMLFGLNIFLGFDGLFYYFSAHTICELRMVRLTLEYVNKYNWLRTEAMFNKAIEHHEGIMTFIHLMSKTYSKVLLVKYLATLLSVCFGMFYIAIDGMPPDFVVLLTNLIVIATFLLPMWIYCFIGDFIYNECFIADAIFYGDWENDSPYMNKSGIILAIQRAENVTALTIGGFKPLNLFSFTELLKSSMSFYAFITTIQEKENAKKN